MAPTEGIDPIHDAARVRIGDAARRLAHAVVGHEATIDEMNAIADSLEMVIDRLETSPRRVRDLSAYGRSLGQEIPDGGDLHSHIARPGSGPGSPYGLDMRVTRDGDGIRARFSFDAAHEGPPQRGHGGIIALAFDDALGYVINMMQLVAYTGQLSIRYEGGAPLRTPLVVAARLARREGRKLFVESEMREDRDDAPVIARCSAIFVEMSQHPGLEDRPTDAIR